MKSLVVIISAAVIMARGCLEAKDECDGYKDLRARLDESRAECRHISDAIVPGESGCALREELRGVFAYLRCVSSRDRLSWIPTESNAVDWDRVNEDLTDTQIDGELADVADVCQEEAKELFQSITPSNIERLTAALLHPDVEIEGEPEDCWFDGSEKIDLVGSFSVFCILNGIVDNTPDQCFGKN